MSQVLTSHGRKMARLPLDPMLAHMLLRSEEFGCVEEALIAVSMLSSDNVFVQPHKEEEKPLAMEAHKRFASKDGDLLSLISIFCTWKKVKS